MKSKRGRITAGRGVPLLLGALLALWVFSVPPGVWAEPSDPTKDLKRDIKILQYMILGKLSDYPLPVVRIVPEAEFDAYVGRAEEGGIQEKRAGVFQPCSEDENLVMISSVYPKNAAKLAKPMEPDKYFRLLRVHGLYHWAMCKMFGPDHFWSNQNVWIHEEMYAAMIESRFLQEQLGEFSALPEDYEFPKRPEAMPEGSLPAESLRHQQWKLVNDDQGLTQWKTVSSRILFVGLIQSIVLVKLHDRYPNFDLPGQHIPNMNYSSGFVVYFYNAVVHRGQYVGFEEFEMSSGDYKADVQGGTWRILRSWWDKGYIPNDKGLAPDNPSYSGKWVQTKAPLEEEK